MGDLVKSLRSETCNGCDVHIRWMIRRDMPEVLYIERHSFEHDFAWTESDFLYHLRRRTCIGMVAEHSEQVVGYMIYELYKNYLHILNFAVKREHRRCGVGLQMAGKLIGKLSCERRSWIIVEVCETTLAAQLFFRVAGFRAVSVLREFYGGNDAYVMRYDYSD